MTPLKENSCKIVVVIGSGGIKSLAALPILEFLRDHGCMPVELIGSGAGAAVAALFAMGKGSEEIEKDMALLFNKQVVGSIDTKSILALIKVPFFRHSITDAFLNNTSLRKAYNAVFGTARLEDLRPTTRIQLTELLTAEGALFSSGQLADVIYASNAMYPLLSPIELDGKWYVDGSFSSTLPVLAEPLMSPQLMVAINIDRGNEGSPTNFAEFSSGGTLRALGFAQLAQRTLAINLLDLEICFISTRFDGIGYWDVAHMDQVLHAGRVALKANKEQLVRMIEERRFNQFGQPSNGTKS
jgi:NTE family protein